MVRAIYKDGAIQPVEAVPPDWRDGQELIIDTDEGLEPADPEEIERWNRDVDEAASQIPPEDYERLFKAIEEHRREAKAWMRREMGLDQ